MMDAYPTYRMVLKSQEQLAASQMNTLFVGLASLPDVSWFAQNVENVFSAHVATINQSVVSHYQLPYPVGTPTVWRLVLRDNLGHVQTTYLHNIRPSASISQITTKLMDAGLLLYPFATPVTSIQISIFTNDR